MPIITGRHPSIKQLREFLGIPAHCIGFTLHVRHNTAVRVECEYYPEVQGDLLARQVFELKEPEIKPCICADPENCTEPVPGYRCRRRPKDIKATASPYDLSGNPTKEYPGE